MRKIVKIIIIISVFLLVFSLFNLNNNTIVFADDSGEDITVNSSVDEQLSRFNFGELQQIIDNLDEKSKSLIGDNVLETIKKMINGELSFNFATILNLTLGFIGQALIQNIPIFVTIILISILGVIISQLKFSDKTNGIGSIIHFVSFGAIIVIVTTLIMNSIQSVTNILSSIQLQMKVIFPMLLTLLTALGSSAVGTIFQPSVAIICGGIIELFSKVILPIFIVSFVFSIVGNLSENIKLEKFGKFFSSLYKWIIGIIFSLFTTFLTIFGISAKAFDNFSIKSAKFALKSYIPIVGKYLSDGINIILVSSVLIKNSIGVIALLILISTILMPIITIIITKLLLSLSASIVEPFGDKLTSNFLSSTANSFGMLIATIASVGFMYIIMIALIISSVNIL